MSKLFLPIYENGQIAKIYECEEYDMMFGTLEDMLAIAESANSEQAVAKQMNIVRPLVREIFPGISDQELRKTKVKDVFSIIQKAMIFATSQIEGTEKNG
jgi:hypothetical protein